MTDLVVEPGKLVRGAQGRHTAEQGKGRLMPQNGMVV